MAKDTITCFKLDTRLKQKETTGEGEKTKGKIHTQPMFAERKLGQLGWYKTHTWTQLWDKEVTLARLPSAREVQVF